MKLVDFNDEINTDINSLRKESFEVKSHDISRLMLVQRLREANKKAWTEGCGIAAIQIGVFLRFGYVVLAGKEEFLINPKIITRLGKRISEEGCLSIPDKYFRVERAIEIEYLNDGKKKRAKGFKALVIQHEIDHMDGILVCDKK